MIKSKDLKGIALNAVLGKKPFKSIKNNQEYKYELEDERTSMILAEFDTSVENYCQFDIAIVKESEGKILETAPGLILQSDAEKHFVIFSRHLDENRNLARDICEQLQQNESLPIDVAVVNPGNLTLNTTVKNIDFLYQHALRSPYNYEDFSKILSLFSSYEELTIGQLKKQVADASSIYQLMFFHGLRADIDSSEINDDLLVYPSPLLRSIIHSL